MFLWDSFSQLECWQFVWWQFQHPSAFPLGSAQGTGEDRFSFSVCNRGPTAAQYHPSKFVADGLYGTFDEFFFFVWVEWSGFHQCWISSKSFKTSLFKPKNQSAWWFARWLFFEKSSSTTFSCLPCWVFPGQKLKLLATLTLTEVPLVRLCDPGFWALAFGQWVPNATEYHRAEAACGLRFWRSGGWWVGGLVGCG